MIQLTTERFLLREYEEADVPAVHAYGSDPEVVRYMLWGPNTEEETREFIRKTRTESEQQPRKNYDLAIATKSDGRLIGGCGLFVKSTDLGEAEIGYVLRRDHWGQGCVTEAAWAMVAFGFEQLGLHRIYARCNPENIGSARVMEKIGMTREGHLREVAWIKERWQDYLVYAILEREWKPK